jgi:hypothetical protein
MASTIPDDDTQQWAGKALSNSNGRWPKRALGAILKRDSSRSASTHRSLGQSFWGPFRRSGRPFVAGYLLALVNRRYRYVVLASVISIDLQVWPYRIGPPTIRFLR